MKPTIIVTLAAAFLLTGCSAPADTTAESAPSKTAAAVTESTTPEPEVEHPEGWEFCDTLVKGMDEYATYVLNTGNGQFESAAHGAMRTYTAQLEAKAPEAMAALVTDFASPYEQINAAVAAGGGSLTLDNASYKASVLPLMTFCNGVGYTIDG